MSGNKIIEHYQEMLKAVTDPVLRHTLEKLLLEEEVNSKKWKNRSTNNLLFRNQLLWASTNSLKDQ